MRLLRHIAFLENAGTNRIIDIVIDVCDAVGNPDNAPLQRLCRCSAGVAENAISHFICKVQTLSVVFQKIHNPDTLLKMPKSIGHNAVERPFAGMAERGMTEIMTKRDGFGKILIEAQGTGNGAGNL